MKLASYGKINADGIISSSGMITEKEGYEAMLYMLKAYWEATGSNDLTDILSGGGYWGEADKPTDTAYWEYWLEAIEKVRKEDSPPLKKLTQHSKSPQTRVFAICRIEASSLKEFKYLVQQLSKPASQLTKTELQQFEKLTEQFGGKLRYDLNPVKGKILQPHVQVEGLGTSVGSRYISVGVGVK